MKFKIEFTYGKETLILDTIEIAENETLNIGPVQLEISHEGFPPKWIMGYLHITQDTGMIMDAGVSASEVVLNVRHGEET